MVYPPYRSVVATKYQRLKLVTMFRIVSYLIIVSVLSQGSLGRYFNKFFANQFLPNPDNHREVRQKKYQSWYWSILICFLWLDWRWSFLSKSWTASNQWWGQCEKSTKRHRRILGTSEDSLHAIPPHPESEESIQNKSSSLGQRFVELIFLKRNEKI